MSQSEAPNQVVASKSTAPNSKDSDSRRRLLADAIQSGDEKIPVQAAIVAIELANSALQIASELTDRLGPEFSVRMKSPVRITSYSKNNIYPEVNISNGKKYTYINVEKWSGMNLLEQENKKDIFVRIDGSGFYLENNNFYFTVTRRKRYSIIVHCRPIASMSKLNMNDERTSGKQKQGLELHLPDDLLDAIEVASQNQGISQTDWIKAAISDRIDNLPAETPKRSVPSKAPALWSERTTGREVSPADFICAHYGRLDTDGRWHSDGLRLTDIKSLDPSLYQAYATWSHRHPSEALNLEKSGPHNYISDPKNAIERRRASARAATQKHRSKNL